MRAGTSAATAGLAWNATPSPASRSRIACEYTSSPVAQPACQTFTWGQLRSRGTTFSAIAA